MNKIRTKEELIQDLNKWKKIISNDIYSYIVSLIELDDYILQTNIIPTDIRENLLELDIYREVSMYNIYWQLQNIFSSYQHNNIVLEDNRNQIDGIKLNIQTKEEFLNILLNDNNGKENNLIRAKKEEIDSLKSKIELTDTDKELIKIKNEYYQYILESLRINDSTYEEKTSYPQATKILLKSYPEVKVRASIDKI